MVGWHHRLHGREFEQAPGVGDRQGGLVHCSPRGRTELDTIEQLKNSNRGIRQEKNVFSEETEHRKQTQIW